MFYLDSFIIFFCFAFFLSLVLYFHYIISPILPLLLHFFYKINKPILYKLHGFFALTSLSFSLLHIKYSIYSSTVAKKKWLKRTIVKTYLKLLACPLVCILFDLAPVKAIPGSIYAVYSQDIHSDGLWYRVKVLKVKGDKAHIEYMDYGDKGVIPISSLRSIPSRFLELPFQVCDKFFWLWFYFARQYLYNRAQCTTGTWLLDLKADSLWDSK